MAAAHKSDYVDDEVPPYRLSVTTLPTPLNNRLHQSREPQSSASIERLRRFGFRVCFGEVTKKKG